MKLFEMTMGENDGVYAMSLVEAPATEEQFIALATDAQKEIKLSTLVEDKQILVGAALVPKSLSLELVQKVKKTTTYTSLSKL